LQTIGAILNTYVEIKRKFRVMEGLGLEGIPLFEGRGTKLILPALPNL
jgi:hypothetical protein